MALTERLMVLIDSKAVGGGFKDVQREAATSTGLVGKLGDKAGVTGATIKSAIGVGAVGGLVAFGAAAVHSANKFVDLASTVDDFQDVSGASARDASQLVNVVKQLGIAPEAAAKGMFKLGREIGSGKSALDEYGIAVARNTDGTTDLVGTLANVSEAFRGTTDAAQRNAIANAAFGRAGGELIDLLDLTEEQLRALSAHGPIFSQEDIDNAKLLQVNMRAAGQELDAMEVKVGRWFAKTALNFSVGIGTIQEALGLIPKGSALADLSAKRAAASASLMADESRAAAEALKEEEDAADKLSSSLFGTVNARRAVQAAARSVTSAEESLAGKQRELNDLLKRGAVDAKAVAAAERDVASATRTVASAKERVVAAEDALRRARGYDPEDLAEADLSRREAALGVADAVDRVQSATEALDEAQRGSDPEAVDDATRDLAQANLSLERAQRAATAAAQAQQDLNPNSEAGARRLKDAEVELWDATSDQAAAVDALKISTDNLNAARAGDPEFLAIVRDRTNEVRDAEQNVADAKWNHLQQAVALHGAIEKENELLSETGKRIDLVRWKMGELAGQFPQFAGALGGISGRLPASDAGLSFGEVGGGNWDGSPMNVSITVTSMNPNDVVAAIKKYERSNGSSWRSQVV